MNRHQRLLVGALALVVLPFAIAARVGWSLLATPDRSLDRDVHTVVLHHKWLLDLARALTHFGDPTVVTIATGVLAIGLFMRRRRSAATYVLLVRLVAVGVSWVAKTAVDRSRPVLAHPVAHASGLSFPSGHALGSAAFFGSVAMLLRGRLPLAANVAIATVVPIVVGVTRVLLGVHFPSDVIAGWLLGWACASLLALAVEPG